MVTEIDMEVQTYLVDYLKSQTGCNTVISEELRLEELNQNNFWVIDPLDGTHNFISGLPFYGISAAYIKNNEILLGAIYFPQSEDLYFAQKGGGAFKNEQHISVSTNNDIEKSIVAYDNQFYLAKKSVDNFIRVQEKVFTTRIFGVATRDACFISEGILDARIWNNTKLCDVATGALIVEEAGGKVSDFSGKELNFQSISDVVFSSGKFHNELIKLLKK
jgi:myo-inositol-1(or 4)-monophosphatase